MGGGAARPKQVHGDVETGFGPVADTFCDQLARGRSIGAACPVELEGELVVDLWGGQRDRDAGLPWERDTLVPVFSTTKGMAMIPLAIAHSRGQLDLEQPVAAYWPEFGQHGKQQITVRQLLSHQAGLAALAEPIEEQLLADPDALAPLLARQAPLWRPGTRQGYHAITFGFYACELLRRVDPAGGGIGRAFAEDVAEPLGIDFHIGLPDHIDDHRLARFHGVHPARGILHIGAAPRRLLLAFCNPRSLTSRAFKVLPIARHPDRLNDRRLLRHGDPAVQDEVPSASGWWDGWSASPSARTNAAMRWRGPAARSKWQTRLSGSGSPTPPTRWASAARPTPARSSCGPRSTDVWEADLNRLTRILTESRVVA